MTDTKTPTPELQDENALFMTSAEPHECWPLIRDYHYSRRMPGAISHCYVWRKSGGLFGDSGEPVAAALYSSPPARWSEEVLELTRLVRHPECDIPLTALLSQTYKYLKAANHSLLVSFADWTQNHHGGIYQAASWNFDGQRKRAMDGVIVDGIFVPGRSAVAIYGTRSPEKLVAKGINAEPHYDEGKFLYWKPLNKDGKKRAERLGLKSLPYVKPNITALIEQERQP